MFKNKHIHSWIKVKLLRDYYDYSGNHVGVFLCKCVTCGREKIENIIRELIHERRINERFCIRIRNIGRISVDRNVRSFNY